MYHVRGCSFVQWLFLFALVLSACSQGSSDHTGPVISNIKTSGSVLVISDCAGTSVSISAKVTDSSGVKSVSLRYRVADQPFASHEMMLQNGVYEVSLQGLKFSGQGYGTLEFYIEAKDEAGNLSKSPSDKSIQFLPCVNN